MIAKIRKRPVKYTVNCTNCRSFKKDKSKYGGNCKATEGFLRITRYRQAGVPAWCPKGVGI